MAEATLRDAVQQKDHMTKAVGHEHSPMDPPPPPDCEEEELETPLLKVARTGIHDISDQLLGVEDELCGRLGTIQFGAPVTHIYNPLSYASETHQCFVRCYGNSRKRVMFLGMNPGPFGMAQTGVPFGDIKFSREWLRIRGHVSKPPKEHPKRTIDGLDCKKSEVSGTRFWGLMQQLCKEPEVFFKNCYVHNYCPFCFMMSSGKNVTPPTLRKAEREALERVCDKALLDVIELLGVEWVIGVGKYAEKRASIALGLVTSPRKGSRDGYGHGGGKTEGCERNVRVCSIIHPSPINPAANKDWTGLAIAQLTELGVLDVVKGL